MKLKKKEREEEKKERRVCVWSILWSWQCVYECKKREKVSDCAFAFPQPYRRSDTSSEGEDNRYFIIK